MPNMTEADLEAIEDLARENHAETYRGPLLALVDEVRRLREIVLTARPSETAQPDCAD